MIFISLAALSLVSAASAAVITVTVGEGGAFAFKPNSVTAQAGDVVNFQFVGAPGNHTVTQAAFSAPCAPLSGGFDSSYVPVPKGFSGPPAEWNLTVSDASKPIWFYCKQTAPSPHCITGMVGAINAPSSGNTIDAFTSAAKALGSFPAQSAGALSGVGAAATASPSPLAAQAGATTTSPSSPSGTSTGKPNAAVSVASNGLWSLFAAVLGLAIV